MDTFLIFIWPFTTALLITLLATPLSLIAIKKLGLFDDPKSHKHPAIQHKRPIPRGGGIPMVIGILLTSFFFLPITPITITLYLATSIALIIGVLDDKLDVSPYVRFLGNIVVAAIVVGSGVSAQFVTHPLGGIFYLDTITINLLLFSLSLADIVAIFWIVWVMNMLNWSKGVDGQMPGIVAISALVIGFLSLRFPLVESNTRIAAELSFILAGSAIGFLFFNFYPAKIFPGYGATAVYLLLSVVSILSSAKLATAILVMGVPLIDGCFTIARRILTGHSPFWHDNKHLHHLLLRLGLGHRSIALLYWTISAILGLISLTLSSQGKFFAIIMLVVIVSGVLLFLHLSVKDHDKKSL